jgi:two-component system chemotaxis response regulator CheY
MEKHPSSFLRLDLMPARVSHFKIARATRTKRQKPRVLVVEDQLFSRKLLLQVLSHDYQVDAAPDARTGILLYLENAPDIVFLDIELTDESGHSLARAIKTLDPDSYIIMVTANNSVEDVALAKSNKVDGFIVKPYSKSKIFEAIEKFEASGPSSPPKGNAP